MSFGFYVKVYIASVLGFFIIDMVWLGLLAKSFYKKHLGFLLSPSPNWPAATIFYLLFVAGLVIFVVVPAIRSSSFSGVLLKGALFGLITYATYDLTNLATIRDWPLIVTVVDLLWGVVLSTSVGVIGYLAGVAMR